MASFFPLLAGPMMFVAAPDPNAQLPQALNEVVKVSPEYKDARLACDEAEAGLDDSADAGDTIILDFPCRDRVLLVSQAEAKAIAGFLWAQYKATTQQEHKRLRPLGEILASAAVAVAGEAVDRAPAVDRDPTRDNRAKPRDYQFDNLRKRDVLDFNVTAAFTFDLMSKVGTCSGALEAAITRMEREGTPAAISWSKQARRTLGKALYGPDDACV